jgi:hypothetical protein
MDSKIVFPQTTRIVPSLFWAASNGHEVHFHGAHSFASNDISLFSELDSQRMSFDDSQELMLNAPIKCCILSPIYAVREDFSEAEQLLRGSWVVDGTPKNKLEPKYTKRYCSRAVLNHG